MKNAKSIFPPLEAPLINHNGKVSDVWYRFFVALFRRTGSETGEVPDPGDIDALIRDIQGVKISDSDISLSLYRDLVKRIEQLENLLTVPACQERQILPDAVSIHQLPQCLPDPVAVLQSISE